jgi:adenosylmethionine---8-amino-7-oxononanoate aminotransferase
VMCGMGRTGTLFACEQAGVSPDVMCVGKALTGGYMSLAATLCTPEVASSLQGGALMHGPTYMGNPLACSVALASTELLLDGGWQPQVRRIERTLTDALAPVCEQPGVRDVRVLGAIAVIELDGPVDLPAATAAAVERGVWLRPFRNLVYTMPPYITHDDELRQIAGAMLAAAQASAAPDTGDPA